MKSIHNKPVIETNIPLEKELENLSERLAEEELALQNTEEHYALLASTIEEPVVIKDVIVNEENSVSGASITKAYKMVLKNGKWTAQPLWILTESKIKIDSIQMLKDSLIRPFHIIQ